LVRRNFDLAILAIILVSLLPTFIEVVKARRSSLERPQAAANRRRRPAQARDDRGASSGV